MGNAITCGNCGDDDVMQTARLPGVYYCESCGEWSRQWMPEDCPLCGDATDVEPNMASPGTLQAAFAWLCTNCSRVFGRSGEARDVPPPSRSISMGPTQRW